MTATVEQTQNDLFGMIRRAVGGEEIVITQGGEPVAKLTGIQRAPTEAQRQAWLERLRRHRAETATGVIGKSSDEMLEEDRADRL
jgi:prevent-host-death family protein